MAADLTEQELRRWAADQARQHIASINSALATHPWIPEQKSFNRQAEIFYNYVDKKGTNG